MSQYNTNTPILVTKSYLPPKEIFNRYIDNIWETHSLTNNGPLVRKLTEQIKDYLNVENLVLVNNGTLALQLAIKALKLKGEIITTPYSYVATTNSILWEGCTPKFIDIESNTFCIDPKLIEKGITENTQAILATHVYGYPCDMVAIQNIATKYNLKIIYDAAHAFGVRLNGKSILLNGDCSTLSFHATKLFHTVEGGGVICNSSELANHLFMLSKFGHMGDDLYTEVGINAKLSEMHAAMGLSILPEVTNLIQLRKKISETYDSLLEGLGLQRPQIIDGLDYNYAYYPIIFKTHQDMNKVRLALENHSIFPRRYFYPSLNTIEILKKNSLSTACPISESIAQRVLCLPLYPDLTIQDTTRIGKLVRDSLK